MKDRISNRGGDSEIALRADIWSGPKQKDKKAQFIPPCFHVHKIHIIQCSLVCTLALYASNLPNMFPDFARQRHAWSVQLNGESIERKHLSRG